MAKSAINELGDNIRMYRARRKFSQADLGRLIGVSDVMIGFYESGKTLPPIDKLIKIAHALEVPVAKLLEGCE